MAKHPVSTRPSSRRPLKGSGKTKKSGSRKTKPLRNDANMAQNSGPSKTKSLKSDTEKAKRGGSSKRETKKSRTKSLQTYSEETKPIRNSFRKAKSPRSNETKNKTLKSDSVKKKTSRSGSTTNPTAKRDPTKQKVTPKRKKHDRKHKTKSSSTSDASLSSRHSFDGKDSGKNARREKKTAQLQKPIPVSKWRPSYSARNAALSMSTSFDQNDGCGSFFVVCREPDFSDDYTLMTSSSSGIISSFASSADSLGSEHMTETAGCFGNNVNHIGGSHGHRFRRQEDGDKDSKFYKTEDGKVSRERNSSDKKGKSNAEHLDPVEFEFREEEGSVIVKTSSCEEPIPFPRTRGRNIKEDNFLNAVTESRNEKSLLDVDLEKDIKEMQSDAPAFTAKEEILESPALRKRPPPKKPQEDKGYSCNYYRWFEILFCCGAFYGPSPCTKDDEAHGSDELEISEVSNQKPKQRNTGYSKKNQIKLRLIVKQPSLFFVNVPIEARLIGRYSEVSLMTWNMAFSQYLSTLSTGLNKAVRNKLLRFLWDQGLQSKIQSVFYHTGLPLIQYRPMRFSSVFTRYGKIDADPFTAGDIGFLFEDDSSFLSDVTDSDFLTSLRNKKNFIADGSVIFDFESLEESTVLTLSDDESFESDEDDSIFGERELANFISGVKNSQLLNAITSACEQIITILSQQTTTDMQDRTPLDAATINRKQEVDGNQITKEFQSNLDVSRSLDADKERLSANPMQSAFLCEDVTSVVLDFLPCLELCTELPASPRDAQHAGNPSQDKMPNAPFQDPELTPTISNVKVHQSSQERKLESQETSRQLDFKAIEEKKPSFLLRSHLSWSGFTLGMRLSFGVPSTEYDVYLQHLLRAISRSNQEEVLGRMSFPSLIQGEYPVSFSEVFQPTQRNAVIVAPSNAVQANRHCTDSDNDKLTAAAVISNTTIAASDDDRSFDDLLNFWIDLGREEGAESDQWTEEVHAPGYTAEESKDNLDYRNEGLLESNPSDETMDIFEDSGVARIEGVAFSKDTTSSNAKSSEIDAAFSPPTLTQIPREITSFTFHKTKEILHSVANDANPSISSTLMGNNDNEERARRFLFQFKDFRCQWILVQLLIWIAKEETNRTASYHGQKRVLRKSEQEATAKP